MKIKRRRVREDSGTPPHELTGGDQFGQPNDDDVPAHGAELMAAISALVSKALDGADLNVLSAEYMADLETIAEVTEAYLPNDPSEAGNNNQQEARRQRPKDSKEWLEGICKRAAPAKRKF